MKTRPTNLEKVKMSPRLKNILKRKNISTLDQLVDFSIDDYLKWRGIGMKTFEEIMDLLIKNAHKL